MKDSYDNSDKDVDYFQIKDEIKSLKDLTKFLSELNVLYNNSNQSYIFRGDSSYSGKLQPKLFRKDKNTKNYFIDAYEFNKGGCPADIGRESLILNMWISIRKLYKSFDFIPFFSLNSKIFVF